MGILDKVKEGAAQATSAAKDAAQKGQVKLDAMQANKAAEAALRDLGAAVYRQKTDRETPANASDIDRLVGRLQTHEEEHGQLDLTLTS